MEKPEGEGADASKKLTCVEQQAGEAGGLFLRVEAYARSELGAFVRGGGLAPKGSGVRRKDVRLGGRREVCLKEETLSA